MINRHVPAPWWTELPVQARGTPEKSPATIFTEAYRSRVESERRAQDAGGAAHEVSKHTQISRLTERQLDEERRVDIADLVADRARAPSGSYVGWFTRRSSGRILDARRKGEPGYLEERKETGE